MTQLTRADYRGILDFLRVALENDRADPFPEHVLAELRRLIPAATVSYHEWDSRGTPCGLWLSTGDPSRVLEVWDGYFDFRAQDPLPSGRTTTGGTPVPVGQALKFSDFLTLPELRRLDLHEHVCKPLGVDYVMKLFLPTRSRGCCFVFDGQGKDFSERDRAVLNTLVPHFSRLHERADAGTEWRGETLEVVLLTRREQEVLRLAARGLTNLQIAGALYIAPGTVRKHLDHVYAKLGVQNRTAAVNRAFFKAMRL